MFDWLFGKRQTNYNDTNKMYNDYNSAKNAAADYYKNNIQGKDWGSMDSATQSKIASEYGALDNKAKLASSLYGGTLDLFNKENEENKHSYFGNGLLGMVLNPVGQTIDAGADLVTGKYDPKKRDVASDLGALAETALTFLPMAGGAMKAMKLGRAGAATERAINSLPGLTLTGAGMGAADAYRQGGQDTQPLDVLGGAAMGGLFGGGISAASRIGNNFVMNRGLKRHNVGGAYDALTSSGINPYQASLMATDENMIRRAGMRSLVPQSTFGKVALGGGLLYGGSRLLNSGGEQQPMNYNDYSSMAQDPYAQYGMGY